MNILKSFVIFIFILSTVGCKKNDIKIYNLGFKEWSDINITAGGNTFEIKKLKPGATHSIPFRSMEEGGGTINATLDGAIHSQNFGYFTPNLGESYEIMLKDDSSIWINVVENADN
jgi:hypothetical protein